MKPHEQARQQPDALTSDLGSLALALAIVAIGGLILTAIWGLEPPLSKPSPQAPSAPYYHAHGAEHR